MDTYKVAARQPSDMSILGLPIHRVGSPEILEFIGFVIERREKAIVPHLNIHAMNLALKHSWLYSFFSEAHLVQCDGDGVRWGLRILGFSPPPKVTYNSWFSDLCDFCQRNRYSIYLLGAQKGVADAAAVKARAQFPNLQIAGTHHGYFAKDGVENDGVIEDINSARPDILLTCFGMPEQERWIRNNWAKIHSHVFLSGGASLDYAAGRIARAPRWMVVANLEWFFRLLLEPRRLFRRYLLGNPYFMYRVLLEKFYRHKRTPRRQACDEHQRPVASAESDK